MRLKWHSDTAYVTCTLIVVNVMYFLFLETAGSSRDSYFMLLWGAMYEPAVVQGGQYWRLLTSVFMHFGIEHITNNMLILYLLGGHLERALGRIRYLFFYLLCGAGANVVSLALHMRQERSVVSAGASGAIFGVIGGLIYVAAANRGRLEDLTARQLTFLAALSLYFGFTSTGVDNAAHAGGLILGVLLAAVLYRKPKQEMICNEEERYDDEE